MSDCVAAAGHQIDFDSDPCQKTPADFATNRIVDDERAHRMTRHPAQYAVPAIVYAGIIRFDACQ